MPGTEEREPTAKNPAGEGNGHYQRKPDWLKTNLSQGPEYRRIKRLMKDLSLHTVCAEARCPNIHECWEHGTATFMILGDVCTRSCGFCAVKFGLPNELDLMEPHRVAEAVKHLRLKHVVITSVARDDLADGGASIFADTIRTVHRHNPATAVEVLVPDFAADRGSVASVIGAGPQIFSHNLETVRRLTPRVRSRATYDRSLAVLRAAGDLVRERGIDCMTKSGIMLGLGETRDEVLETMQDLQTAGCSIMTMGQYLRPSQDHLPVAAYIHPDEFAAYRKEGLAMGLKHVEAGPLVRSSYHAHEQVDRAQSFGEGAASVAAGGAGS
ncbi:MAG: lipoyl synthase [Thermaerobacterales bacterium]